MVRYAAHETSRSLCPKGEASLLLILTAIEALQRQPVKGPAIDLGSIAERGVAPDMGKLSADLLPCLIDAMGAAKRAKLHNIIGHVLCSRRLRHGCSPRRMYTGRWNVSLNKRGGGLKNGPRPLRFSVRRQV